MPINDSEPVLKPYSCKNIKYNLGFLEQPFQRKASYGTYIKWLFEMLMVKNEIVFDLLFYVFYVCVQTGVKTQMNTINVS